MATDPATDIRKVLVDNNVHPSASSYVGKEPSNPDFVLTVYTTGGGEPNPKYLYEEPSVQVRVRGPKKDYAAAYEVSQKVKDTLLGFQPQTINSTYYVGITAIGDMIHLSSDDNDRHIFVMNWRIMREPQNVNTNRLPL